jgi:polyhydroxyalkanoate synthesis regulator phasin
MQHFAIDIGRQGYIVKPGERPTQESNEKGTISRSGDWSVLTQPRTLALNPSHKQEKRSATMDQKVIFKQMVDFNKGAFNNALNAMVMVQDQNETLANTMLNQATWMPEEGKKAVQEWVETFKKGREEYKKTVDEAFKKVEGFL